MPISSRNLTPIIMARRPSASASPNVRSISVEEFTSPEGLKFATDHPVTKAALVYLECVWPQAVPFAELLDRAYEGLGQGAVPPNVRAQDAQLLSANLLKGFAYSGRLIELHTYAPQFATRPSERPVASPWARYQAQTGAELTNLCHVRVELKGIAQYLLSHLDGTHDRTELLDGLEKSVAAGTLILQPISETPTEPTPPAPHGEGAHQILMEEMEDSLQKLARAALLIA